MSQPKQSPSVSEEVHAASGTSVVAERRDESAPAGSTHASQGTRLMVLLLVGMVSGIVGGLLVSQTREQFALIQPEGTKGNGILTPEQMAQVRAAQVVADYKNAPFALGILGLVVAGVLGLTAGLLWRSSAGATVGFLVGCLGGALLGALGGLSSVFVREQLAGWDRLTASGQPDPLLSQIHTMALHLPTWIFIAIAAAVAFGIARRHPAAIGRTVAFAALALVVVSLIYPTLAALFFQMENPDKVIPSGTLNLMLWAGLNAGLIGVALAGDAKPGPVEAPEVTA